MLGELDTTSHTHGEAGFTLIEALVAMLTGFVVVGALFAILQIAVHQSSLATDKAQADQTARTTMTHIVDELQSGCISFSASPVRGGSGPTKLMFVNAYSNEAVIPKAYEHEIVWSKAAGTLTDYSYPNVSTSKWPEFTFPTLTHTNASPTSGVQIGTHILVSDNLASNEFGVFQYYKYATASSSSSSTALGTLELIPLTESETLSTAVAESVAAVKISFKGAPIDGSTLVNRADQLGTYVTFEFSAPQSEAPIVDSPCE